MIVVSDTSPVLNLARIGRFELLALLYKQVIIPTAVYAELTAPKRDLPDAPRRRGNQKAYCGTVSRSTGRLALE